MTRRSYHKRAAQKRWQRRAPGFLCGRSKMARERQKFWCCNITTDGSRFFVRASWNIEQCSLNLPFMPGSHATIMTAEMAYRGH